MKFKEVNKSGVIAWSPTRDEPCLAIATANQQFSNANYSSEARIDVLDLNLKDVSRETLPRASGEGRKTFTGMAWSPNGNLILGSQRNLLLYRQSNHEIGLQFESNSSQPNHPQSVYCLDMNLLENHLVATGSSDGHITIWDSTASSMLPTLTLGPMSISSDDDEVQCVQWNRQVKTILVSASNANVHVYDTRKKDQTTPIMRVYDSNATSVWGPGAAAVMQSRAVAWSNTQATTLLVANASDGNPMIQLWDLRYNTSPVKYMRGGHTRGIVSVSWNSYDDDLILTSARDNSVCLWNPSSNEDPLVAVLPSISNQWINEIKWSPWEPSLFAVGAFDGHTTVYNLTKTNLVQQENSQILESFAVDSPLMAQQQHLQPQLPVQRITPILKKAPKWMRVPCGPSWSLGSRLVVYKPPSFSEDASEQSMNGVGQVSQKPKETFVIYQVTTDAEFNASTEKLDNALANDNLIDFCMYKMNECYGSGNQTLGLGWRFLSTHFYCDEGEKRNDILNMLGYPNINQLSESMGALNTSDSRISNVSFSFDRTYQSSPAGSTSSPDMVHSPILTQASLQKQGLLPLNIETVTTETGDNGSSNTGVFLNKCLLTGDLEKAINRCVLEKRWPEALLLSWFTSPQSLPNTLKAYLGEVSGQSSEWSSLLWFVVCSRLQSEVQGVPESVTVLQQLVANVNLMFWKETVAFILRESLESNVNQVARDTLINLLGQRIQQHSKESGNAAWLVPALYCFILSGNYEEVAKHCQYACGTFMDLIEMLLVLQKAIPGQVRSSPSANRLLARYAEKLITEGQLENALSYLVITNADEELKKRLELNLKPAAPVFTRMGPYPAGRIRTTSTSSGASHYGGGRSATNSFSQPQGSFPSMAPPPQQLAYGQPPQPHAYGQPQQAFPQMPPGGSAGQPQYNAVPIGPPPTRALPEATRPNNFGRVAPGHIAPPPTAGVFSPSQFQNNQGLSRQAVPTVPPPPTNHWVASGPFPGGDYGNPSRSASVQPMPLSHSVQQPYYRTTNQQEMPPHPKSSLTSGWNDPPTAELSGVGKSTKKVVKPFSVAPTQVPFGSDSVSGFYGQQEPTPANQPSPNIFQPAPFVQQQPPPPPNPQMQYQNPNQQAVQNRRNSTPNVQQPLPPVNLSEEDQKLINIYDELLNRIQQQLRTTPVSMNIRRKIDDVSQKLQVLRSRLGGYGGDLSPATKAGLKDIAAAIKSEDYNAGMAIHASIVASSTFGETSAFLPALKVLLHLAQQHVR